MVRPYLKGRHSGKNGNPISLSVRRTGRGHQPEYE